MFLFYCGFCNLVMETWTFQRPTAKGWRWDPQASTSQMSVFVKWEAAVAEFHRQLSSWLFCFSAVNIVFVLQLSIFQKSILNKTAEWRRTRITPAPLPRCARAWHVRLVLRLNACWCECPLTHPNTRIMWSLSRRKHSSQSGCLRRDGTWAFLQPRLRSKYCLLITVESIFSQLWLQSSPKGPLRKEKRKIERVMRRFGREGIRVGLLVCGYVNCKHCSSWGLNYRNKIPLTVIITYNTAFCEC